MSAITGSGISPNFGLPRLLDSFNEVIRSLVRPDSAGTRAFAGPGEMAILAIKVLFHETELCSNTEGEISQNRMSRKLRVENSKRTAFRTADCLGEGMFPGIQVQEELLGPLELAGGDVELHAAFVCIDEPKGW